MANMDDMQLVVLLEESDSGKESVAEPNEEQEYTISCVGGEQDDGEDTVDDPQEPAIEGELIVDPDAVAEPEEETGKRRSRKRQRDPSAWKKNIRKRRREAGKDYVDRNGKTNVARTIKSNCRGTCRFKCPVHITQEERLVIHNQFWKLSDEKKQQFYSKFIVCTTPKRPCTENKESRRSNTLTYNFQVGDKNIRVCKEYFLNTLDISQRRVDYFFRKMYNHKTGVPRSPMKGKATKSHIPEEMKQKVRDHINSFPIVESHYCRATSKRQYLEMTLTLSEMYRLYTEIVPDNPVKKSMYQAIFNNEFNLSFHKLKKDRCDHCEEAKILGINMTEQQKDFHKSHTEKKQGCKEERDNDRKVQDGKTAVVCFDLENVISLPRAEVSNFFYKRKLNCYNLTAHCSLDKKAYNAIWHECIAGRGGNHIASALIKILYSVLSDHPEIESIVLWSDACVPQNRNSIMSLALKTFFCDIKKQGNTSLRIIEQKFSEPGHSNIQEVDNVHSRIEKWLASHEVYSPPSLLRTLVQLGRKSNMQFIQMHEKDFVNYQAVSCLMSFNEVPYTKVKHLVYSQDNTGVLSYRTNFKDGLTNTRLWKNKLPRHGNSRYRVNDKIIDSIPNVFPVKCAKPCLSEEKKKDIKSMFRYMSDIDKQFFNAIMK